MKLATILFGIVTSVQAQALDLVCEFKVMNVYSFLGTRVEMVDQQTLGDEVVVNRFDGTKPATYKIRPLTLTSGEKFKFAIQDGSNVEIEVTVFEPQAGASGDSFKGKVTNPEAPDFIKDVQGTCVFENAF